MPMRHGLKAMRFKLSRCLSVFLSPRQLPLEPQFQRFPLNYARDANLFERAYHHCFLLFLTR